MNKTIAFLALPFVCLISQVPLFSQESINTAGGTAAGTGGSVSYSVGQTIYSSSSSTVGSVSQGVQQPFEIFIISSVDDEQAANLDLQYYPSPTNDKLNLKISTEITSNLKYELYDLNSSLLESNPITNAETSLSLLDYASGTYIVKILANDKNIKSFKIIKK